MKFLLTESKIDKELINLSTALIKAGYDVTFVVDEDGLVNMEVIEAKNLIPVYNVRHALDDL